MKVTHQLTLSSPQARVFGGACQCKGPACSLGQSHPQSTAVSVAELTVLACM